MVTEGPSSDVDSAVAALFGTSEGRRQPYSHYTYLQQVAPVHRSQLGFWVVSGYRDCRFVLRDQKFGMGFQATDRRWQLSPERQTDQEAYRRGRTHAMHSLNPPQHTRIRRALGVPFTVRRVDRLRPVVRQAVYRLLRGIEGGSAVDVMSTLAFPLPLAVIGEGFGVPADERPFLQTLIRAKNAGLEPLSAPQTIAQANRARDSMEEYFREFLYRRRMHPVDDLLGELLAASDASKNPLTPPELVANIVLIFTAALETTAYLIGNALLALARHRDQLERLRQEPLLLSSAIDELLRYGTPVHVMGRAALADVSLGGHRIPAGELVITLLAAANRDAQQFREPNRLNIGRRDGAPLSFGGGVHRCLGISLARLEIEELLLTILELSNNLELVDEEIVFNDSLVLRGPRVLHLFFA